MADEIEQIIDDGTTAPGLDAELDAALSNAFKTQVPEVVKETPPVKKEDPAPVRQEAKVEPEKNTDTPPPVEANKTDLPDPETLPDTIPEKQAAWTGLKLKYKRSKGIIQEREEKIKKLETALAEKGTTTTKEVEDLKAKIQELSKYQATTDLQTDPEFVSKFDAPIQSKIDAMKIILKKWSISDEVINNISFTDENTLGRIATAIRENEAHIQNSFAIEKFMSNARDVLDLNEKKKAALDEHGKNYREVLEAKKKEAFSRSAEEEGKTLKHLQEIIATKDQTGNPTFAFLNKLTPKEGSTPAEIAQSEAHNKFVDTIMQQIDSEIKTNDPERKAKLVVAAAASHYLSAQLKTTVAKLKAVEEELAKVSKAGNDSDKTKVRNAPRTNGKDLDLDSALTNHFSNTR